MIHNQAYIDAKKAARDHKKTCSFCREPGYVNYFACPTYLALNQIVSDSITQEQIDENEQICKELEADAKREQLEATFE
jgi:hypothetical protein